MQFILLYHERELPKKTNTGQLLLRHPFNARQVVWARKQPDAELLANIEQGRCKLIYPITLDAGQRAERDKEAKEVKDDGTHLRLSCLPPCLSESEHGASICAYPEVMTPESIWILIDATWQQAQKMFNQSPYLHSVPRIELVRESPSLYRLRKNQRTLGLCTVECAIELLRLAGQPSAASHLQQRFVHFLAASSSAINLDRQRS